MKRTLVLCLSALFLLAAAVQAAAATITIAWDPSGEADVTGYLVSYGTAPGQYQNTVDVGLATTWTLPDAAAGTTYYFTVKAYNAQGVQSLPAPEVWGQAEGAAPGPAMPPGPPTGVMDTPADRATGVTGSIAVMGWAVDDGGVPTVRIYRDPVAPEAAGSRIFIGTAVAVEGARPDVAALYPSAPGASRAGWGYMLLTNMLPNQGNGTFTLRAYATDAQGNEVLLGARTITCDNAHATKPFGAIDTPDQGGTASGTNYVNFGWALTPGPKAIPTDGSTILVYIDGVPVGRPVYNNARADIAGLFPGLANSGGPVGYFQFDTTALSNGVHTIAWVVTDNGGATDGIGSRYFTVSNGAAASALTLERSTSPQEIRSGEPETISAAATGPAAGNYAGTIEALPVSTVPVYRRDGFDQNAPLALVDPGSDGTLHVRAAEAGRFTLTLSSPVRGEGGYEGYLVAGGMLHPLPSGSFLDSRSGQFYWQPGVGFVGAYSFVFVRTENGERVRIPVEVTIGR